MPKKGSFLSSDDTRRIRGRLAVASRADGDPAQALELKREFRVSKLADHIRAVVDEAPPLTKSQKSRLVSLIRNAETGR